jgi:hypothetical protein
MQASLMLRSSGVQGVQDGKSVLYRGVGTEAQGGRASSRAVEVRRDLGRPQIRHAGFLERLLSRSGQVGLASEATLPKCHR